MATPRKTLARSFMQIIWVPQIGDRVLVVIDGKRVRTKIAGEHHGFYLTDARPGHFLKSMEMFYVPRKTDYLELLQHLHQQEFIELAECADGTLELIRRTPHPTIKGRYNYIQAQGTPVQILTTLLDARVTDDGLNQIINSLVERRTLH